MKNSPFISMYKIVFFTVVLISLVCLGLATMLAGKETLSVGGSQLLETCTTCWKLGFGAIVGMIGAKAG